MFFHPAASRHAKPRWQRLLGLSEVWSGSTLSSRLLVLLRWLAVTGQGVTLWAVGQLGVDVPWWPCGAAVMLTLLSNAVLVWWMRQVRWQMRDGFFHIMLWDVLTLTFLLHWTGGLENPFALFYLVQLTLAAVALRGSAVVSLALVAGGGLLWLWSRARPLHLKDGSPLPQDLLTHGFLTALLLAGGFTLTLLLALRRRSHRLQKERERLRVELDSRDRFLSVAALATGFAHELGTPLGTILLAAEEMRTRPDAETAAIIEQEAARCQGVLQRLRDLGQEAAGLSTQPCEAGLIVEAALAELHPGQRARVSVRVSLHLPLVACAGLREALLVLLRNALAACDDAEHEPATLQVDTVNGLLRFTVEDSGPGFSTDMLRHWGEPFRTTREAGGGLGLGLFFVRRLAAAKQGSLEVENRATGGARVTLRVPPHPGPAPIFAQP